MSTFSFLFFSQLYKNRPNQDLKWAMVSQEHHKDGTLHLHVAVWMNKRLNFSSEKYWDFVGGKHGNYMLMWKPEGWIKYILKENSFVSTEGFDPHAFLLSKSKKTNPVNDLIANDVVAGVHKVEDLEKHGRGWVMCNLQKIQRYIQHVEAREAAKETKLSLQGQIPSVSFNKYELEIFQWLKLYSQQKTLNNGCRGDLHLRIQGPTGIGKTKVVEQLVRFFRVYFVPYDGKWFDTFNDDDFDLIVFEEYGKSNVYTPQRLNSLVDGMGTQPLCRRGLAPIVHKKQLPCLMLSNFSWEECYPNVHQDQPVYLDATRRRFKNVRIPKEVPFHGGNPANLFDLLEKLKSIGTCSEEDVSSLSADESALLDEGDVELLQDLKRKRDSSESPESSEGEGYSHSRYYKEPRVHDGLSPSKLMGNDFTIN